MGYFMSSSQTVLSHLAEDVYDFVSNPNNWSKTYEGSHGIADRIKTPLDVGDVWTEVVQPSNTFSCRSTWKLITAERPRKWVFQQIDDIGAAADGTGGVDGITTISYTFEPASEGQTLFIRTLCCELPRGVRIPDQLLIARAQPAGIDNYHDAVARELVKIKAQGA